MPAASGTKQAVHTSSCLVGRLAFEREGFPKKEVTPKGRFITSGLALLKEAFEHLNCLIVACLQHTLINSRSLWMCSSVVK